MEIDWRDWIQDKCLCNKQYLVIKLIWDGRETHWVMGTESDKGDARWDPALWRRWGGTVGQLSMHASWAAVGSCLEGLTLRTVTGTGSEAQRSSECAGECKPPSSCYLRPWHQVGGELRTWGEPWERADKGKGTLPKPERYSEGAPREKEDSRSFQQYREN